MNMRTIKRLGLAAIAFAATTSFVGTAMADHYGHGSRNGGHNYGNHCAPRHGYPNSGYNYGYRPPVTIYPNYGNYGNYGYSSNYGGYNGIGYTQPAWGGGYGMGSFPRGGSYGGNGAFPRGGSYGGSGFSLYIGR